MILAVVRKGSAEPTKLHFSSGCMEENVRDLQPFPAVSCELHGSTEQLASIRRRGASAERTCAITVIAVRNAGRCGVWSWKAKLGGEVGDRRRMARRECFTLGSSQRPCFVKASQGTVLSVMCIIFLMQIRILRTALIPNHPHSRKPFPTAFFTSAVP